MGVLEAGDGLSPVVSENLVEFFLFAVVVIVVMIAVVAVGIVIGPAIIAL